MLIKFNDIVNKYGKPKGVIHIGAHLLEERNDYLSHGLNNTIWIEANPKIYSQIEHVNNKNSNERAFNFAISDIDNVMCKFNITNNGQSSSILELDKHIEHHPHIHVTEILNVNSKRMDSLINENDINVSDYDFINLDIQGAELLALKSFGELIKNFNYIYTEVNIASIYKNCALITEIDEYLNNYNFERVETTITQFEWGDALYLKKNK
jgi:FkbM family methyltransferase